LSVRASVREAAAPDAPRYQQQYSFFDPTKVNRIIRVVSLSSEIEQGLTAV